MYLPNLFKNYRIKHYDSLLQNDSYTQEECPGKPHGPSLRYILYTSTVLPWSCSALLLVALVWVSLSKTNSVSKGALGSYESGFVTDIGKVPARTSERSCY